MTRFLFAFALAVLLTSPALAQEQTADTAAAEAAASAATTETVDPTVPERISVKPVYIPQEACNYIKDGKPFETQLDVFTQEGVYTFCGKTEAQENGHITFLPVYAYRGFISWADHPCAIEGQALVPSDYRARCLKREYFVDKEYYCKRDGDKDGDGFVDNVKNVPVGLVDKLGAVIIEGTGGSGTLVTLDGADIDTATVAPAFWSDIGNIYLPAIAEKEYAIIARSYAFPRPNAKPEDEGVKDLDIVVHDRQSDILKNTYFSEALLKNAGSAVTLGKCK